jgi:pimeloyl-ACP methyl ester carboxylesterase
MTILRRVLLIGSIALALTAAVAVPAALAHDRPGSKPTIVLVHGAFADASGWNDVASRLTRDGYPVIAPANPLRGVSAPTPRTWPASSPR